jgi:hypothetical protein
MTSASHSRATGAFSSQLSSSLAVQTSTPAQSPDPRFSANQSVQFQWRGVTKTNVDALRTGSSVSSVHFL